MNRFLLSIIASGLFALAALPAHATTIATNTAGSNASLVVATTPTGTLDAGQTYGLKDEAYVLDTTNGVLISVFAGSPRQSECRYPPALRQSRCEYAITQLYATRFKLARILRI